MSFEKTGLGMRRFADTLRPADSESGIIAAVSNTDFLQAISLFYTRERRREAELAGRIGKDLPAITESLILLISLRQYRWRPYSPILETLGSTRQTGRSSYAGTGTAYSESYMDLP
jgi:hypothetical protein